MKAVILAGGKGRRLLPYTTIFPKPLVPIGDRPVVDLIVRQLVRAGIDEIILSIGHLGELIEAYFHNGRQQIGNLQLSYCRESTPLGTAGPLALIPGLSETFLAMNGDVFSNLSFRDMLAWHRRQRADLTIAVTTRRYELEYGTLHFGEDSVVTDYLEKPAHDVQVSMGIYVYEPAVLELILPGEYLDFPDLVTRLIRVGKRVVAYTNDAFWLDIGRREDYELAQAEYEKRKDELFGGFLETAAGQDRVRS
jgi:NDP-sugar pyrophosphorylase family protein